MSLAYYYSESAIIGCCWQIKDYTKSSSLYQGSKNEASQLILIYPNKMYVYMIMDFNFKNINMFILVSPYKNYYTHTTFKGKIRMGNP